MNNNNAYSIKERQGVGAKTLLLVDKVVSTLKRVFTAPEPVDEESSRGPGGTRFKRIVMVQFKRQASAEQMQAFKTAILHLASVSTGLVSMDCGPFHGFSHEGELAKVSPDVQFGDFVSIWTFASEMDLNRFIENPEHKHIAATYFKPVVERRYVINHLSYL